MMAARESTKKPKYAESLVYIKSTDGHRQSYFDITSSIFGLDPISGKLDLAMFLRLVSAERLLFATLDENVVGFPAVATIRCLLRRRTVALFLRPQKCFETSRWYYPLKRYAFRILRLLPCLTLATITPFGIAPHYRTIAHISVPDPQYWDLYHGESVPQTGHTDLSEEIVSKAAGRRVLCLIGGLSANKGLPFLIETLERHPEVGNSVMVVGAGRVHADAAELVARLKATGALVTDRFITDAELRSLYSVADLIWACYAPDYDQASGVFGRAIQYGVTPLVRQGSLIESFAIMNDIVHASVPYGDSAALVGSIENSVARFEAARHETDRSRRDLIYSWKEQFSREIRNAL